MDTVQTRSGDGRIPAACRVVAVSRPLGTGVEGGVRGTTRGQELHDQRHGGEKAHRGEMEGSGRASGKDRGATRTQLPRAPHSRFARICSLTLEGRALSTSLGQKQAAHHVRRKAAMSILHKETCPLGRFSKLKAILEYCLLPTFVRSEDLHQTAPHRWPQHLGSGREKWRPWLTGDHAAPWRGRPSPLAQSRGCQAGVRARDCALLFPENRNQD